MSNLSDADVIDDFKQFISVAISQQTADMREDFKKLDQKFDNLSIFVADAIDAHSEDTHTRLNNHEQRINRLEASRTGSSK